MLQLLLQQNSVFALHGWLPQGMVLPCLLCLTQLATQLLNARPVSPWVLHCVTHLRAVGSRAPAVLGVTIESPSAAIKMRISGLSD